MSRISPLADVHPSAEIGSDCTVESGAVVGPGVRLGDGCHIGGRTFLEGDAVGGAEVGPGSHVGPMCVVGPRVKIGPECRLHGQVMITGRTTMGRGNEVHAFAVLGGDPQDLAHSKSDEQLIIGDHNVFREHVTVNRGTPKQDGVTRVGSRCLLMAASHVAHDCVVEDRVVLTNAVLLAGHVRIGGGTIVGGNTVFSQFVSVGRLSYLSGSCAFTQDVPPFVLAQGGYKARPVGVNVVGLRRAGMPATSVRPLQIAFQRIWLSGLPRERALEAVQAEVEPTAEVRELLDFVRAAMAGRHGRRLESLRDLRRGA